MGTKPSDADLCYQVRLQSGRILGPLDLKRMKLLIQKKHIFGQEMARLYPNGSWQNIYNFFEIAQLFLPEQRSTSNLGAQEISLVQGSIVDEKSEQNSVKKQEPEEILLAVEKPVEHLDFEKVNQELGSKIQFERLGQPLSVIPEKNKEGKTEFIDRTLKTIGGKKQTNEREKIEQKFLDNLKKFSIRSKYLLGKQDALKEEDTSHQETILFSLKSHTVKKKKKATSGIFLFVKNVAIVMALGSIGYDLYVGEPKKTHTKREIVRFVPLRPELPNFENTTPDSRLSEQFYAKAMQFYVQDHVSGYRMATEKLRLAIHADPNNVKAIAMLASSYLNLIDVSNKDENYFMVILKLIEMSRLKNLDLLETIIADVEFYIVTQQFEVAQTKIVEYTRDHKHFGLEMFFYLATTFYAREDYTMASRYLNQFPEQKIYSAKIFYLRGQIAEKLNDQDTALHEYEKAVHFNQDHLKSRLKCVEILNKKGHLKDTKAHLDYILDHQALIDEKLLALAYYFQTQLDELNKLPKNALGNIDRACKLDPENHDYLLELYTLRSHFGDLNKNAKKDAKMYYYLIEGEKLIQAGKYQDALIPLLESRQANEDSALPLMKIGDMFTYLNDLENAKKNYQLAAQKAPNQIQVWSKYIQILIQSFEWDEAMKAMDHFRAMPQTQSFIDKAAGDVYQSQGRFLEAQGFYKKAMAREVIDSSVYIAYGKSLMSTKNFQEAPFFFALGLRFDPLSQSALLYTAQCIAETQSIDRAIQMLQTALVKVTGAKQAELLSAIAELTIKKGDWVSAQQWVDQAKLAYAESAVPWKVQASIDLNQENVDKNAVDRALKDYQSYLDRNVSDPVVRLEYFQLLVKKADFEKAKEQLSKIYEHFPKFPRLHFYFGKFYSMQGNHRAALDEFSVEYKNNQHDVENLNEYGNELQALGSLEEALKFYALAMQLAPRFAAAKQNAAWTHYLLKQFQPAIALMEVATHLDAGNPLVFRRLGIIYRDMGNTPLACQAFKKYLEMEPDAVDRQNFALCF